MTDDKKLSDNPATSEQLKELASKVFARRKLTPDGTVTAPCNLDDKEMLVAFLDQLEQIPNKDHNIRKQINQLKSADLSKAVIEKAAIEKPKNFNFFKFAKKREMSGRFEFFARECTLKESGFNSKEEYEQTLSKLNSGETEVHNLPLSQLNMGSLIQLVIADDPNKQLKEVLLWKTLRDTSQRTTNMDIVYLPEAAFKQSVMNDLAQYQHRLNIPYGQENTIEP